ncbi:MAG: LptF/LptG family permease [Verrucomicrobia bacterium]|nr:LptF/LptG family permease [Verrucomicrobiota bacterium]
MRTLHFYLLRQVLVTLFMTVCVFTLVLLLGNVLKEIVALLVTGKVTLGVIVHAVGLLIPYIMAYVLPFAMLTATLLTFGRFSADNELTAVRASGISLLSLCLPVLILSVLLAGLCAWFNFKIAPECRVAYKQLIFKTSLQNTSALITEDRFIDQIPGIVLYVRKRDGDLLKDVRLYTIKNNEIEQRISAAEGSILWENNQTTVRFELRDAVTETRNPTSVPVPNSVPEEDINSTNSPLVTVIQEPLPENTIDWVQIPSKMVTFGPINLETLARSEQNLRIGTEMTHTQLLAEIAKREAQGISASPAIFELHRQVALSFATVGFALIGIPLGIRAHRRETSIGMAISILLVMVYYSFFIFAQAMESHAALRPWLLVWVPNFLFQGIGAVLLWRANRQG